MRSPSNLGQKASFLNVYKIRANTFCRNIALRARLESCAQQSLQCVHNAPILFYLAYSFSHFERRQVCQSECSAAIKVHLLTTAPCAFRGYAQQRKPQRLFDDLWA
jgi:hypothetical protein